MFKNDKELIHDARADVYRSVRTVCSMCKLISKEEFSTQYGIVDWEEKAKLLGLDISEQNSFATCPVFCNTASDEIHTCALCFALLILSKGIEITTTDTYEAKQFIKCLTNTIALTAICNEDEQGHTYVYWPTTISTMRVVESGTCNQTTVALSTLLRIGFLEKKDNVSEQVLTERYRLAVNALSWLICLQKGEDESAWAYGEACTDCTVARLPISYSVLSSHFCYETIKKYISYFNSPDGSNEMAARIQPNIIDRMHSSCDKFEKWVERKLDGIGGISKTNLHKTPSVLHTCLSQIIFFFDNYNLNTDRLNEAIEYVAKSIKGLSFNSEDLLESYQYRYRTNDGTTGYKSDTYEIVPEYVYINYSTRLLKSFYARYLSKKQVKKLKEANYIAYRNLFRKKSIISCNGTDDCLVLQGVQSGEERRYPIYALYDLQVCLLELLSTSERNQKISIIRKPVNRVLFLSIGISILGLIVVFISLAIDSKNTITGILMTVLGALVKPITSFIKSDK